MAQEIEGTVSVSEVQGYVSVDGEVSIDHRQWKQLVQLLERIESKLDGIQRSLNRK